MRAIALLSILALAACHPAANDPRADANGAATATATATGTGTGPAHAALSLTRLDCGSMTIKNFDKFFSDKPGLYSSAPRDVTDSCYLIRHGRDLMLWDTGLPAALKGHDTDMGDLVAHQRTTIVDQLAQLGIKPGYITIVGLSHSHSDHTGQAAAFPQARLIVGAADFALAQKPAQPGGPDPIASWTKPGAKVEKVTSDTDVFGDGSVTTLHLPGHTPDHMGLLVKLASGAVILSGDTYHSREARAKRGVPPFNTSRAQSLASMDRIERLVKDNHAKLVIQHEPLDIPLLPAFPAAAR